MRWLATRAALVLAALISPTAASGITFGEWASGQGYRPGAVMPNSVTAAVPPSTASAASVTYDWTTHQRRSCI